MPQTLTSSPTPTPCIDPWVHPTPTPMHGPLGLTLMWYLYCKYECFLTNGCQDIDLQNINLDKYSVFYKSVLDFFCLFELMLYVPVNSQGHVGTLPPLYGTFTQNEDVMTSNKCLKYNNHPTKP